ncbi:hypothetical protein ACFV6Z_29670 [Streptomyces sp. NPDC059818]|uniref:hypothetical protein n=1 Tax=Streptomyces sp. NPDC059818 TaxID=3346962 RepID=UPI003667FDEB
MGDRARVSHGMGLHVALAVSLADHCLGKEHPHPGFVILNSLLAAYQPGDPRAGDEDLADGAIPYFYRDLPPLHQPSSRDRER